MKENNDENGSQKEEAENQGDEQRVVAQYDDENGVQVQMSIWVWEEVLKFITRMEMADRVSLVCCALKKLCWPRLHGRKVKPHVVEHLRLERKEDANGQTKPKLVFLESRRGQIIPMATGCPPPDYIQGFKWIDIHCVEGEVLKFVRNISPQMANIRFHLFVHSRAFHKLRALLHALNGRRHISYLNLFDSSIPFAQFHQNFPALLEAVPAIYAVLSNKRDGAAMNELCLAKIRGGKSFVMKITYSSVDRPMPIDKIRKLFGTAKQPQSFSIALYYGPQLEVFQVENAKTGEILALERFRNSSSLPCYELYRRPSGKGQQWREDAQKLLRGNANSGTFITYRMQ